MNGREASAPQTVRTGLDRVLREDGEALRGRRLAVLCNRAAVDGTGRPIVEALAQVPDLRLCRIYSPEHGFAVDAEAGAHVESRTAGPVPVVSLYGDRAQPSAAELAEIDLLVVDLPDVGARYYTYMATMKSCMAACAASGVPLLVLDRPNPLGGVIREGPVADVFGSLVCCAPIPIRHGLTLGELARFFQGRFFAGAGLRLDVLAVENWRRDRMFADCGLPWLAPSPNLPSVENALMYVGACLFEGLNLNEGRGTETPFLLCGAPWLAPEPILAELREFERAGVALKAVRYTPRAIPGKAANPRYRDAVCEGIAMRVTDPRAARPLTTVLALIGAIWRRHPELEWSPFFDTLAGGPWLREQIQAGVPVADSLVRINEGWAAFDAIRPQLYPSAPPANG
jgi:uncharacterized protein YbbC (DUF1343 family)